MALMRAHQVVVVCGETGSGKTTQLPKMALALGRGRVNGRGLIGHTQPRRIAASSVAKRIAAELNTPLGDVVGYNADPAACLEIVRDMNCPTVKGNHDEDASGDHSLDTMNPIAAAALEWTREQLSDEQREWLRRLRMVRQVSDFTVVHSTLDQPSHWNYVTNRFDAMANFSYQFTQIAFHECRITAPQPRNRRSRLLVEIP